MTTSRIQTCKRCLYNTSHPLGLVMDKEGICSGCRVHEEKDSLDWADRWQRLESLVKPYRGLDSRNYDCIVPVTGAGDSFFIVHVVKELLGLKPLLVTYNRYYNTPLGIRNLAQLRRHFDCDLLIQSVNPSSVKRIIRTTLRELGSFHWPAIAGQSVFPVQTAVSNKVPLIIWGAHQGVEQVGMFSHLNEAEMTRRHRKDHDLMGLEADDLLSIFDSLKEEDIWQFRYPDENTIERIGVKGIYLGNFIRWDPLAQHKSMSNIAGCKSGILSRTFDVYDHTDDWHYMNSHDVLKMHKHGYSKVVDQVCREIRHNRINREEGLKLISFYQNRPPRYQKLLTSWLNLKPSGADFLKSHMNFPSYSSPTSLHPDEDQSCNIATREEVAQIVERLNIKADCSLRLGESTKHVIIGKGYP